jgi:hypothetical protein
MYGGDGGFVAADPTDPNMMYGEYVYLQIHRSIDGGNRSTPIYGGIDDAGNRDKALFIAPFILDPANPDIMLAGGAALWRSPNVTAGTPAWTSIKEPLARLSASPALISAVEARPTAPGLRGSDIIWVGYSDGRLFRSKDGLSEDPSWQAVGALAALPRRFITRIRVDSKNTDVVYVSYSGYQAGNLWRTQDGGATWKDISGGLPEVSVYDLALHPSDSSLLYLATEVGVFASADGGDSWWPTNQGPANVSANELFWLEQKLITVTHGRGLFWIDLSQASPASAAAASAAPASAPAASPSRETATASGIVRPVRNFVRPVSPLTTQ